MSAIKGLWVHAALWALAYAGLVAGSDAAENVLLFVLWAFAVVLVLAALAVPNSSRRTWVGIVQTVSWAGMCVVMAAESRFVLASALAIGVVLVAAKKAEAAK